MALILNPFKEEYWEKWTFILMIIKNCAQNLIKTVMFNNRFPYFNNRFVGLYLLQLYIPSFTNSFMEFMTYIQMGMHR
jgi:hypothetical protein